MASSFFKQPFFGFFIGNYSTFIRILNFLFSVRCQKTLFFTACCIIAFY